MFQAKTQKIAEIIARNGLDLKQIELLLSGKVNVYIDYANVRPWAVKLGWHIDMKRLMQFLRSFDNIGSVKVYTGTLTGDTESKEFIKSLTEYHYDVRTKPVKIMKMSIDTTSVHPQATTLLQQFVRSSLLRKLDIDSIEFLNSKLRELNAIGTLYLEDRKCNFDVEIGRDMLVDHDRKGVETFVLWSGDSDFAEPVRQLLADGKKVVLFATVRRVSSELNALRSEGLLIFDIQKIRNLICWKKEIST